MFIADAKPPLLIDQKIIQKVNAEEGKYVNLSCHMKEGSPLPNITWFKVNLIITNN